MENSGRIDLFPDNGVIHSEEGAVMVVTLMVLVLVTLVAFAGHRRSVTELTLSTNEQLHQIAFQTADSGTYVVPKLISDTINARGTLGSLTEESRTYGAFTYLYPGTMDNDATTFTFYRELYGFEGGGEFAFSSSYEGNPADLWFEVGGGNVASANITRVRASNIAGGGAEFSAETDGSGARMQGIYYDIDSYGNGPRNSVSNLGVLYLKVIGTAGGL